MAPRYRTCCSPSLPSALSSRVLHRDPARLFDRQHLDRGGEQRFAPAVESSRRWTEPREKNDFRRPNKSTLPIGFVEAGQEAGKTPIILPVASVRRKLSGSGSGWRSATSRPRLLAAAIAAAALVRTDVSLWTGTPFLSHSIPNITVSSHGHWQTRCGASGLGARCGRCRR
jgi:hypothetical protein